MNPNFYRIVLLLAWSLSPGIGAKALADVHTYDIRSIDSGIGIDGCKALMNEAAEIFGQTSSTKVIASGCEFHDALGSFTGKIVYSADKRATIWSTDMTTYGNRIDLFYTQDQCEKALTFESEYLRHHAALRPFWARCDKVSNIGPARYRSRIDAVGTTNIRRYETTAYIDHPLSQVNQVVSLLRDQATNLGLTPVAWYHGPVNSLRGLSVAYYSEMTDHPQRLLSKSSRYFSTVQDCELAAAAFSATRTVPWVGVTACSAAHPSIGFQLNLLWWGQQISPDSVLHSTPIPGDYENGSSCQQAAKNLAEQLARQGEKVVGVICGRSRDPLSPIQIELITLAL